ncbi:MAG: phytoene desaturase [Hydrogenophaga sp.]|jgi:phytoene desaturase|nr:phytoene desaturase [Hydrogenophaga sp.]
MNALRTDDLGWATPARNPAQRDAPHAIVIGSGFGGLASAVRLAAKGWRVTVLEKLDTPGGRARVHHQNGHIFDAGPTIITVPFLFHELWALAGRKFEDDVQLVPLDPFYRIRFADGDHFDYSGDPDRQRAEVKRICPSDAAGYERFMAEADHCYELGFAALGAKAFDTVGDLVKASPAILKMRGWRTLHGMVASHLKHPKLRIAMSLQSLLIGGNPFSVTCIYSLINALERQWGVHWAMGGTGRLVQGLVKLLQGQGGVLRCNAEVRRIEVDQGRATGVTLASGERIAADIVVSNADTAWTYRHLIESQHRRHWTDSRIDRGRYSMSLFVWYFGTNRRYDDVPHHMMLLGPRYKELLRDIFERHKLADDFSLYLHRPTATDASMAPDGHDTFYALAPVPHLDSGTDWSIQSAAYRKAIAEVLDRTVLPGFESHVTASLITTPQDFHDNLLSLKGAAFGLEPVLTQSAWFRPHNRSEDIDQLYMVGASTHPGAGVPGVLMSAKALDSVVPDAGTWKSQQRQAAHG